MPVATGRARRVPSSRAGRGDLPRKTYRKEIPITLTPKLDIKIDPKYNVRRTDPADPRGGGGRLPPGAPKEARIAMNHLKAVKRIQPLTEIQVKSLLLQKFRLEMNIETGHHWEHGSYLRTNKHVKRFFDRIFKNPVLEATLFKLPVLQHIPGLRMSNLVNRLIDSGGWLRRQKLTPAEIKGMQAEVKNVDRRLALAGTLLVGDNKYHNFTNRIQKRLDNEKWGAAMRLAKSFREKNNLAYKYSQNINKALRLNDEKGLARNVKSLSQITGTGRLTFKDLLKPSVYFTMQEAPRTADVNQRARPSSAWLPERPRRRGA